MKPAYRHLLNIILTSTILFTMLYTLVIPTGVFQARAQEATETAAPPPTEETETPTEVATQAPEEAITETPPAEVTEEEATATAETTEEATEEATAEATATVEATAEATVEVTPETTVEATAEATPELTPEVTPEITPEATDEPTAPAIVLSADFEGEIIGWTVGEGASVVSDGDNNSLQMAAGGTFMPADLLYLSDFRVDGRLNIPANEQGNSASGMSLSFHTQESSSYILSIEVGQTALYRDDGAGAVLIASSETEHTVGNWHQFSLDIQGGHIVVVVDDTVEIDVTEESPLLSGQFAFTANEPSGVMLDDIVVASYSEVEVIPTPTPLTLSPEAAAKLDYSLQILLNTYLSGDEAGATELMAQSAAMQRDEANTVQVVLYPAAETTPEALLPLVELVGGGGESSNENSVTARVSLGALLALVNTVEIRAILLPEMAVSTSPAQSPTEQDTVQAGNVTTHGLDILGANDWHGNTPAVLGGGVNIAVIDTGFTGIAGVPAIDRDCLASASPVGGAGTGNHGVNVVEVICDIAPSSRVTMYQADNATELSDQIKAADGGNDIIVITLDLGANASPGDGAFGRNSADDPYEAITAARNAGVLVIAAAGNNRNRYRTFTYNGGTAELDFTASTNDLVNVSWSQWPTPSGNPLITIEGEATVGDSPTGATPSAQLTIPDNPLCNPGPCDLTLDITGATNGVVFQVQITGTGTLNAPTGSATEITTTGSMGRPADSLDVLAVGAVCSDPATNFPILTNSSRGPIFATGGTGPRTDFTGLSLRESVKPDLVGPSYVSTTLLDSAATPCESGGVASTAGFGGTSAAAAHVAGMAALLISNTNNSMDNFDTGNTADDLLEQYMQTHAIDLPASTPNGFGTAGNRDNTYGAGLSVLGGPNYDLTQVVQPANPPSEGATAYVGLYNPDSTNVGTLANPYIHPAYAVAQTATGSIVFTPGEYVTPFFVQGKNTLSLRSYDAADGTDTADSVFQVNTMFTQVGELSAGINIRNSTSVEVEGFVFNPGNPVGYTGGAGYVTNRPRAVGFTNVTGNNALLGSSFTIFTGLPVQILDSNGVTIEENIFSSNAISGGLPSVMNIDSSGQTTALRIQGNTFSTNSSDIGTGSTGRGSVMRLQDSEAQIFNNRFASNNSFALIRVNNTSTSEIVDVFGNLFTNNSTSGPILHLEPGERFRFINNTLIQNTMSNNPYGGVVTRGNDPTSFPPGGLNGGGTWEFHNNLLYANNIANGVTNDITGDAGCDRIGSPASTDDGAQNNWVFPNTSFADCTFAIGDPGNDNIIYVDLDDPVPPGYNPYKNPAYEDPANPNDRTAFVGLTLDPNDPFRIVLQPVPNNFGIDTGNQSLLTAQMLAAGDLLGNVRVEDGDPLVNPGDQIDIGAYELVPLSALPIEITCVEDAVSCATDLTDGARGGFGVYTFSISSLPTNFSTNVADTCGGDGVALTGSLATYCPPRDFYTDDPPDYPVLPGATAVFNYTVEDATDAPAASSTVTVYVTPVTDPDPTIPVPDYTVVTSIDQQVSFRARPYVRFQNFRLSDPSTATGTGWVDYPFTYSGGAVVDQTGGACNFNPSVATAVANANTTGFITLTPTGCVDEDFITFTYTADDEDGDDQVVTVTLLVLNLPEIGLHDDTSFAFSYYGAGGPDTSGGWTPSYNETSINNTVHQSLGLDDVAEFAFEGTGFVLYVHSDGKGGNWQLLIDGENFNEIPGVNCTTSALIVDVDVAVGPDLINGKVKTPYTVACTGLLENELHTIQMVNKTAKRALNIDAIQVLREDAALRPGFYEVNHPDLSPFLFGSTTLNDKTVAKVASNGIASVITNSSFPTITIPFRGTGIAIGTTLETNRDKVGATYSICVTPSGGARVCQDFDNGLGGTTKPVWGVYRPFVGLDPDTTSTLEIDVTSIPADSRFIIDSIVVLKDEPLTTLGLGVTEDDVRGPFVFGNGRDDSWTLDTNNRRTSNGSLTSVTKKIPFAGPFISFEIPAGADTIQWYRFATAKDSKHILICVDRAEAQVAGDQDTYCIQRDISTAPIPNPLIIRETMFNDTTANGIEDGSWTGTGGTHTVEIFSLTNLGFNADKFTVLDSDTPLAEGYYEEFTGNIRTFDGTLALNDTAFTTVSSTRFSGGSVKSTTTVNSGVLFQFNGTGFSTYFTFDKKADAIRICYVNNLTTNVNTVLAGTCRNYDNESASTRYQAARTILGLADGNYTAVVQMLADDDGGGSGESPTTMQFDAVAVYDDPLPGNILNTTGIRYETDYLNRVLKDTFLYYGAGWVHVTGSRASKYSGSNYDSSPATAPIGAGVLFRTNGADRLIIYRDTRSGYAPIEVCVDGVCADYQNNVGTGNQVPLIINLGSAGAHTVSIVKKNYGIFNLDALELVNANTALGAGQYQESYPALEFGGGTWDTNFTQAGATNGKVARTVDNGAYLEFTFNGTGFELLLFESTLTSGSYNLCVDPGATITAPCDTLDEDITPTPTVTRNTLTKLSRLGLSTNNATFTVRLTNTSADNTRPLLIDRVDIVVRTLTRGLYEETYGGLIYDNGTFADVASKTSSGGSVRKTTDVNGRLVFEFSGTGFEVGTIIDRFGSEMRVCYEAGALTATAPGNDYTQINQFCYDFQNESSAISYLVSRSIAGLADTTYSVRVELLDDGTSILTIPPGGPRDNVKFPATMSADYVRIFDEAAPPQVTEAGWYSESATDDNGVPFLQLLPSDRWVTLTGNAAKLFSNQSAVAVGSGGRALGTYAGPLATLRVQVPAGGATVILYTGAPSVKNGDLLVCLDNFNTGTPDECATDASVVNALRTSTQVVLDSTKLPGLGAAGSRTLTFRTTTPSFFRIDGFQVIYGTTLAPGVYDETLAGTLLDFSPAGAGQADWSSFKSSKGYGGNVLRTGVNGATLTFDFEGSGFSIITENLASGVDMRVCYKLESDPDPFPPSNATLPYNQNGVTCELVTTDTTAINWNATNLDRPLVATAFQYGFAYYGLPANIYSVEARVVDSTIVAGTDFLRIDAVAVFGDVTDGGAAVATVPGVYDDANIDDLTILYGPEAFWLFTNAARSGPPRGPYNRTEHTAANAGTVAQVLLDGNALVIYQSATGRNSNYVRVCLVVPNDDLQCSEFSQNSRRVAYFTPVVIYGLGAGEKEVVIENRYPGRTFSIDGIGVLP